MISLHFKEAVAIIEPMGRHKNMHNMFKADGDYSIVPCESGFLITHPRCAKSAIPFPATFVPNENIRCVEGTVDELTNIYAPGPQIVAVGGSSIVPTPVRRGRPSKTSPATEPT